MLSLENLSVAVRALMVEEIDHDVKAGILYFSERMNDRGRSEYPALIRDAAEQYDDAWLEGQINQRGLLNAYETRNTKNGPIRAKVPYTAAQTFAEAEFNRFYLRALCRFALDNGIEELQIYRAKQVENPRSESYRRIGTMIGATALLNDLRTTTFVDTALKLPQGPNSGLSARIPVLN